MSPRFTTRESHSETCLLGLEPHFPTYIGTKIEIILFHRTYNVNTNWLTHPTDGLHIYE